MYGINTADAAQAKVEKLRMELIKIAQNGDQASTLSQMVHEIAYWEGATEAFAVKERLEERGREDEVLMTLTMQMTRGSNDTWSGRGNDLIRSSNDGSRAAVQTIVEDIKYGSK